MDSATHPLPPIPDDQLWSLVCRAEELGLKLEVTQTGITWETSPGLRHQELIVAVLESIERRPHRDIPCECYRAIDVAVRFPDGTVKRPDVAIFCRRPAEEEGFIHSVPEAVVEITSPGYEDKDLESGRLIYLANGVKDVLVLDRRDLQVHHWHPNGYAVSGSPKLFQLSCGCTVTV